MELKYLIQRQYSHTQPMFFHSFMWLNHKEEWKNKGTQKLLFFFL